MKRLFALFALLALTNVVHAAVAIDSGSAVAINAGTGTTFTQTVTTSGADNLLVVYIHAFIGQSSVTSVASGCTYNSVAMTLLTSVSWPSGSAIFDDDVWYLESPAIGGDSLVCTYNGANGGTTWQGGTALAAAFSGTSASAPIGSLQNTTNASAQTVSVASLTGTAGANDLYLTFGNQSTNVGSMSEFTGSGNMTNYLSLGNGSQGGYSLDTIAGSQTGSAATYTTTAAASYFIIGAIPILSGGAACTHNFWSSGGTFAVPNGSTGSYWSLTGAFATPNCSTGSYWLKTGAAGAT